MVNNSINVTVDVTETLLANNVIQKFLDLIRTPMIHTEMIWTIIPLFTGLILMQLYFGRYRNEELGWNTAVGNSLALLFVSANLARHIYESTKELTFIDIILGDLNKTMIVSGLALISLWLLFGDFFHLMPKKIAFWISSSLPTTLIAYMGMVLVYTDLPLDLTTLMAGILLFVLLTIIFGIIHFLEPISLSE